MGEFKGYHEKEWKGDRGNGFSLSLWERDLIDGNCESTPCLRGWWNPKWWNWEHSWRHPIRGYHMTFGHYARNSGSSSTASLLRSTSMSTIVLRGVRTCPRRGGGMVVGAHWAMAWIGSDPREGAIVQGTFSPQRASGGGLRGAKSTAK